MTDCVIGFDAGGTKTTCCVMGLDGTVLAKGRAGTGNYQIVREAGVGEAVAGSFQEAAGQLAKPLNVRAAFLGIAGVTTATDRERVTHVVKGLHIAPSWQVAGDAVIALAAGTGGREGVVVIAGTGAICWGCDADGRSAVASGWGYLLGDEGSGFQVAQAGLIAAFNAYDGRGPATPMVELFLQAAGLTQMPDFVGRIYGDTGARRWVAGLAPVVFAAAAQGDRIAAEILAAAGDAHARAVVAVAHQLSFPSELPVVAAGGLFEKADGVYDRLAMRLADLLPAARLMRPAVEPAIGACYLARRLAAGDPWPVQVRP